MPGGPGRELPNELPVHLFAWAGGRVLPWPRGVTAGPDVNLVTHPLAWLPVGDPGTSSWPGFVAVECGVSPVEAGPLLACRRHPALIGLAALAANAASCLAGVGASLLRW